MCGFTLSQLNLHYVLGAKGDHVVEVLILLGTQLLAYNPYEWQSAEKLWL